MEDLLISCGHTRSNDGDGYSGQDKEKEIGLLFCLFLSKDLFHFSSDMIQYHNTNSHPERSRTGGRVEGSFYAPKIYENALVRCLVVTIRKDPASEDSQRG